MSQWEYNVSSTRELKLVAPSAPRPAVLPARAARLQLQIIDLCLDQLEEMHLTGTYINRQRGCQQLVARLATALRSEPPDQVLRARNSYALHAALLNWQAIVLDGLVPNRRQRFPDLADEEWTVPRLSKLPGQRSASGLAQAVSVRAGGEPRAWGDRQKCSSPG